MLHQRLAHIGGNPESRQVRTHQRAEIHDDGGDGKGHGHPSVVGDAAVITGYHIPEDSPDIEERYKGEQLAHG